MKRNICFLFSVFCFLFSITGCAGVKKLVVPPFPEWRNRHWEDKELWGNQGNFSQGYAVQKVSRLTEEMLYPVVDLPVETIEQEPIVIMEEAMPQLKQKELPVTYTVQKGDCLWFIAGYPQIYGNPLMWPKIYEANRNKIKNPDLIYPGQVFIIPRPAELREEEEKEIEYEK